MTTREEIREGINTALLPLIMEQDKRHRVVGKIIHQLYSQGVVIKGAAIHAGQRMKNVYRVEALIDDG